MTAVNSYAELLSLDAEDFLHAAYQLVLGRAPDDAGLVYYEARLRVGYSKLSVLHQLGSSGEQCSWDALPGLRQAMWRYRMGQWPIVGGMLRRLWRVEGESVGERLQRSMISKLAASAEFHAQLTKGIAAVHAELQSTSGQISDIATIQSQLHAAAMVATSPREGSTSSGNKLLIGRNLLAERLSSRARESFNQLMSG